MIEITNLHKKFENKDVLTGVNLDIHNGEALAIIGGSGSGKSVLLKHIVGLLEPDEGTVKVNGKIISELKPKELYEVRRKFGYLFQGAALFDSLTVEENVELPVVENDFGFSVDKIKDLVSEKLELVGLPGIEKLKPSELSGGMRKRVGLARALVTNPEYLLYDEPTTGLDPVMSDSIDDLIKELNEKLSVTSIVITHDMFSVKRIADRVAMVYKGKIYFHGTPEELKNSDDEIIKNFLSRTGF
ncbi:MAG: ABC transporter ATP-binding protein [Melioribacteraceae bacterium]|nr:MAG: ABC transporter ATP-binding protein [Melioribacteraceae bacterium]